MLTFFVLFWGPTEGHISLCQAILFLIFGRSETFIGILGFVALGLESTLPIPQLVRYSQPCFINVGASLTSCFSNYRQRSLYGFRMSTLVGWVGGDSFKCVSYTFHHFCTQTYEIRTLYFFLQHSPLQFKVCAIFQLSIDCGKHPWHQVVIS